jgi:endogenous inhibitor of DNA gyrase (YacG/DUF329 family)
MSDDPVIPIPVRRRRCPICGKPAAAETQPFCSPRCATIDLGRWLSGNYRIASDEPADADDEGMGG